MPSPCTAKTHLGVVGVGWLATICNSETLPHRLPFIRLNGMAGEDYTRFLACIIFARSETQQLTRASSKLKPVTQNLVPPCTELPYHDIAFSHPL